MRILICGASGFVGLALTRGLRALGHEVVRGVRRPAAQGDIKIDYSLDTEPAIWEPRLVDIDAVVNAVGIITECSGATFEDLHQRSPIALFEACARLGVKRVLQISVLGADSGDNRYFRTKRGADRALMSLPIEWQVLRPSLVYGEAGTSASAFRLLASLPMIPVPSLPASAQFQPVHIDDLVAAAGIALDPRTRSRQCIDCAGATSHTLRGMLSGYRNALWLGSALWLPIPSAVMAIAARVAGLLPGVPLTSETWRMLQRGNAAPPDVFAQFLGRAPRGLAEFIPQVDAERLCARAMSAWQLPLLRICLAAVWILSAIVGAFLYPRSASFALLAQVGLTAFPATVALYSASALDFLLGLATLLYPNRLTWMLQALLIVAYSLIITARLPEWLVNPFGPVLKNLPMLAILVVLLAEKPSWSTSP